MPIKLDILLDKDKLRQESKAATEQLVSDFAKATGQAEDDVRKFVESSIKQLEREEQAAKRAAEATAKQTEAAVETASRLRETAARDTIGALGDLKDVFEYSAQALFGLSEAQVDAAVKAADIAEKGAMIGIEFGPLGALVGAGLGAALGFANAEAERLLKLTQEVRDAQGQLAQASSAYAAVVAATGERSISDLQKQLDLSRETELKQLAQVAGLQQIVDEQTAYNQQVQYGTDYTDQLAANTEKLRLAEDGLRQTREYQLFVAGELTKAIDDSQASTQKYQKSLEELGRKKDLDFLNEKFGELQEAENEATREVERLRKKISEVGDKDAVERINTIKEVLLALPAALREQQAAQSAALAAGAAAVSAGERDAEERKRRAKERDEEIRKQTEEMLSLGAAILSTQAALRELLGDQADISYGYIRFPVEAIIGDKPVNITDLSDEIDAELRALADEERAAGYTVAIPVRLDLGSLTDLGTVGAGAGGVPVLQQAVLGPWEQTLDTASQAYSGFVFGLLDDTETVAAMMEARLTDLYASIEEGFGDVAADAAAEFFDQLQSGEVSIRAIGRAARESASDALKGIGTQMVGQGIADALRGAVLTLLGNPAGPGIAALGGVEVATGLAMGGGGALLGRGLGEGATGGGGAPSSAGSGSFAGSVSDPGPQTLAPVNVYLGPQQGTAIITGDGQAALAAAGRHFATATAAASQAGPALQRSE